ncbi:hypothetical protein [Marinobacterium arenosum]|uniref:hypothetical protein n=1 Tax=Marinobacterium arenosum TaxID=2862496 RepID=UPI001C94E427|nr:hypothetical protein [Marinobacterium arenosum]MBY4677383.1 hypothetical protein [Marinobacterium arenosum]
MPESPRLAEQLTPVDDRQVQLTRRWLQPNLVLIESELLRLREQVDPSLERQYPAQGEKAYPIGRCLEISQAVYRLLQQGIQRPQNPAQQLIRQFVAEGGVARRVWGALRESYFQNAFQFGTLYVDVANDTVDPAKPKVEILPLSESGFCNIRDFEHFQAVAGRYWQCEVYANHLLPTLSPLFPLLIHYPATGRLSVETRIDYMLRLNMHSGFRLAQSWLASGGHQQSGLPSETAAPLLRRAVELGIEIDEQGDGAALDCCRQYRDQRRDIDTGFLQQLLEQRNRLMQLD